ncbi:hypothetical protein MRX96_005995 [Rhipicephalus microplus]
MKSRPREGAATTGAAHLHRDYSMQRAAPNRPGSTQERALIFCLLTYYIKNLEYPPAFSPALVLLQKIALPDTPVPRGLLTNRLKNLLLLLGKKNV